MESHRSFSIFNSNRSFKVKVAFFKTLGTSTFILLVYLSILNYLRAPISAEYWVRELIIIKHSMADKINSRKIILAGGSSVLFGFDAAKIERSIGIPCLNYGLHAAMRLEWLLDEVKTIVKPGDILIMALEPTYYNRSSDWSQWQLRNSIAWNISYIEKKSLLNKMVIYQQAGTLDLAKDLVQDWFASRETNPPEYINKRNAALLPKKQIIQSLGLIKNKPTEFPFYRKMEIDDHGAALQPDQSEYMGDFDRMNIPSKIAPYPKSLLGKFISEMKERNVKVYFVNAPYGCDSKSSYECNINDEENLFNQEIRNLGSECIDIRKSLLIERSMFFDTSLHLNKSGKNRRTEYLIEVLRKKGIGANS
jgi:hypothetical protein